LSKVAVAGPIERIKSLVFNLILVMLANRFQVQKLDGQINGKNYRGPKNHPRGRKSDNLTLRCGLGHEPAFLGNGGLSTMPEHGKPNLENPGQTAFRHRQG
jgi:hypothetical protein